MIAEADRQFLRQLAWDSIRYGLANGSALPVDLPAVPPELQEVKATFVTLEKNGDLRGCIGTLEAFDPLAVSVARNSFAAAFEDPRFDPVQREEIPQLTLHVSVLTTPEPFAVLREEDAIHQLRTGIDGLILTSGSHRATFLPSVWEQLPDPRLFLRQLKRKAGLPPDSWPLGVKLQRYQVELL